MNTNRQLDDMQKWNGYPWRRMETHGDAWRPFPRSLTVLKFAENSYIARGCQFVEEAWCFVFPRQLQRSCSASHIDIVFFESFSHFFTKTLKKMQSCWRSPWLFMIAHLSADCWNNWLPNVFQGGQLNVRMMMVMVMMMMMMMMMYDDDDDDDDDDDHDDETTMMMMIMIIIITIVIMIINPTQSPKSQKRGMDQNIDNLSFPTFSQKIIGSHTHTIMLSSGRLFPRDPLLPGLAGLSHGSCDSSQIQGGVAAKAL